jgi:rhodanese-related sulfurtransferase
VTVPVVSAAEAVELIAAGALLIDVREQHEWDAGHAPQARLIPMSRFTQDEADTLPKDRPIVCVCHLGMRSASIANALVAGGWNAINLSGGMSAWEQAGLPVVTDDGSPGQVH